MGSNAHARLAPHIQRADALGAVHLVRRERRQIHAGGLDVERHLADALHRVGVEQRQLVLALDQLADGGDVLDHADLVVGQHDRDQQRLVGDGGLELAEVDAPVGLDRQVGDLEALLLEALHRVEHRLVLGLHRDEVVAAPLVEPGRALDGEVVRLGRARGEDDLLGAGADQGGDVAARLLDGLLGAPAEHVGAAGGVAEVGGEVRQHGLEHTRIHRRGRVVVHEDGELEGHQTVSFALVSSAIGRRTRLVSGRS